jgi:hypothetical protein
MPLFSESELLEMRERYLQREAERQPEQQRSKAEILIEIVRKDPGVDTVRELAEASGMSPSWVRRVLRAAGLRAANAPRGRRVAPGDGVTL